MCQSVIGLHQSIRRGIGTSTKYLAAKPSESITSDKAPAEEGSEDQKITGGWGEKRSQTKSEASGNMGASYSAPQQGIGSTAVCPRDLLTEV